MTMDSQSQMLDSNIPPRQLTLPNSTAVLVLGILSIVLCCCFGLAGLTLGIIALVLADKDEKLYRTNPLLYDQGSYKNLQAGKICAIIGTCFSGLTFLYIMVKFLVFGAPFWSSFSEAMEKIKQM